MRESGNSCDLFLVDSFKALCSARKAKDEQFLVEKKHWEKFASDAR